MRSGFATYQIRYHCYSRGLFRVAEIGGEGLRMRWRGQKLPKRNLSRDSCARVVAYRFHCFGLFLWRRIWVKLEGWHAGLQALLDHGLFCSLVGLRVLDSLDGLGGLFGCGRHDCSTCSTQLGTRALLREKTGCETSMSAIEPESRLGRLWGPKGTTAAGVAALAGSLF